MSYYNSNYSYRNGQVRTIYRNYVVDDGWNLPKEVIEAIDLRISIEKEEAYKLARRAYNKHKGKWLTEKVARMYEAKSWVYRVLCDDQYVGKVREIGEELQAYYGVTEIEAINILRGNNIRDYVEKYERIRSCYYTPINEQQICNQIAEEYIALAQ